MQANSSEKINGVRAYIWNGHTYVPNDEFLPEAMAEIERLERINAKLVEACRAISDEALVDSVDGYYIISEGLMMLVDIALAEAEGGASR